MDNLWIYVLGLLAQGLFSARMLVQWIRSEKAHTVVNPTLFWVLSLAGSLLFFLYGWLRQDGRSSSISSATRRLHRLWRTRSRRKGDRQNCGCPLW